MRIFKLKSKLILAHLSNLMLIPSIDSKFEKNSRKDYVAPSSYRYVGNEVFNCY